MKNRWKHRRSISARRYAGVGALVAALVTVTACSSGAQGPSESSAPAKDSIVVVQPADIASLNMNIAPQRTSGRATVEINESAVKIRYADGVAKLIPGLATSWEQTDTHTWRFHVRPNVTFTNGEKLTAAAFKTTLDQYREDPAGKLGGVFANIEINVIDDATFDVVTKEPNLGSLPAQMTSLAILPPEYRGGMTEAAFGDAPVGTGPYMLDSWQKGVELVLKANPEWWGGKVKVKTVTIKIVPDAATRVGMLETGAADLITDVPPQLVSRVDGVGDMVVKRSNSEARSMLVLNTNTPPTDDIRVRKAINYALDKRSLVQTIFGGYAKAVNGPILQGELGYDPKFKGYEYSPEKAKKLVDEYVADGGNPEVDLNYTIASTLQDEKLAEAVQAMLVAVGFKVTMKGGAFATLQPVWRKPGASSGIYSTTTSVLHPDISFIFSKAYFHPKSTYGAVWTKEVPELTALIDEAYTTADPAVRTKQYAKIQEIIMDEALWAPMFSFENVYGATKDLKWNPVPDDRFYFEDASF